MAKVMGGIVENSFIHRMLLTKNSFYNISPYSQCNGDLKVEMQLGVYK